MTELVSFLVRGLVSAPDQVRVNQVEGEASLLLELSVAPHDMASLKGPDDVTIRAIRTVLSASSGRRKAILELVEPGSSGTSAEE